MKLSADYRASARENLKNNWGTAIVVSLIILGISAVLGFIPVVGYIATIILSGQLAVAEQYYFIALTRKSNPTIGEMFKDFGKDCISNFVVYLLELVYTLLWMLLFIIPGIIKTYSYAMTMYLKAKDSTLGANEAITKSRQIMDGKKWKLFCLHFSFIGWILLSILTFGIGLLFLMPYMSASQTAFFEDAYNEYLEKQGLSSTAEEVVEPEVEG